MCEHGCKREETAAVWEQEAGCRPVRGFPGAAGSHKKCFISGPTRPWGESWMLGLAKSGLIQVGWLACCNPCASSDVVTL